MSVISVTHLAASSLVATSACKSTTCSTSSDPRWGSTATKTGRSGPLNITENGTEFNLPADRASLWHAVRGETPTRFAMAMPATATIRAAVARDPGSVVEMRFSDGRSSLAMRLD
ncbi:MAG: hypothetical protein EOO65_00745 [Methanosarcinales archaeon]|nr:MAG: hypothetical protein EOO65_00745 [Methanosarcinales archaeon]